MEYFAAIKQDEVDLNMIIWKILQVISLSEKARFGIVYIHTHLKTCVDIHTVYLYIYVYLIIMISFGYKFEGFTSSLCTGNLFKGAGSRVNGVYFGVQDAFILSRSWTQASLVSSGLHGVTGWEVGPVGL